MGGIAKVVDLKQVPSTYKRHYIALFDGAWTWSPTPKRIFKAAVELKRESKVLKNGGNAMQCSNPKASLKKWVSKLYSSYYCTIYFCVDNPN